MLRRGALHSAIASFRKALMSPPRDPGAQMALDKALGLYENIQNAVDLLATALGSAQGRRETQVARQTLEEALLQYQRAVPACPVTRPGLLTGDNCRRWFGSKQSMTGKKGVLSTMSGSLYWNRTGWRKKTMGDLIADNHGHGTGCRMSRCVLPLLVAGLFAIGAALLVLAAVPAGKP